MTPTETQYLADINTSLKEFSNTKITEFNIDRLRDKTVDKLRISLLQIYVEIMEQYLRDTVTGDENFFTTTEAEEIMQHINDITGEYHWLDLT